MLISSPRVDTPKLTSFPPTERVESDTPQLAAEFFIDIGRSFVGCPCHTTGHTEHVPRRFDRIKRSKKQTARLTVPEWTPKYTAIAFSV